MDSHNIYTCTLYMERLTTFTRKLLVFQNWNYYFFIHSIRLSMVVILWHSFGSKHEKATKNNLLVLKVFCSPFCQHWCKCPQQPQSCQQAEPGTAYLQCLEKKRDRFNTLQAKTLFHYIHIWTECTWTAQLKIFTWQIYRNNNFCAMW